MSKAPAEVACDMLNGLTVAFTLAVTIVATRTILRRDVKTQGTAFDVWLRLAAESSASHRPRGNHLCSAVVVCTAAKKLTSGRGFCVRQE